MIYFLKKFFGLVLWNDERKILWDGWWNERRKSVIFHPFVTAGA